MQEIAEYYGIAQQYLADNTFQEYGILGLFFNSLLSATAIPLPTEILTSALLMGGESEINVFWSSRIVSATVITKSAAASTKSSRSLGCIVTLSTWSGYSFSHFSISGKKHQESYAWLVQKDNSTP